MTMAWGFLAISGCAGSIELAPEISTKPLFRSLDVSVGTFVTAEARTARVSDVLASGEIGRISDARFEQAFAAMFRETRRLPDWPPWRHTPLPDLMGVIELESVDGSVEMGNDLDVPDVVTVAYRICLYRTNGEELRCWDVSSTQSSQRGPFELDFSDYLSRQFEFAVRDAVAQFLVQAEQDPVLLEWASE